MSSSSYSSRARNVARRLSRWESFRAAWMQGSGLPLVTAAVVETCGFPSTAGLMSAFVGAAPSCNRPRLRLYDFLASISNITPFRQALPSRATPGPPHTVSSLMGRNRRQDSGGKRQPDAGESGEGLLAAGPLDTIDFFDVGASAWINAGDFRGVIPQGSIRSPGARCTESSSRFLNGAA